MSYNRGGYADVTIAGVVWETASSCPYRSIVFPLVIIYTIIIVKITTTPDELQLIKTTNNYTLPKYGSQIIEKKKHSLSSFMVCKIQKKPW